MSTAARGQRPSQVARLRAGEVDAAQHGAKFTDGPARQYAARVS